MQNKFKILVLLTLLSFLSQSQTANFISNGSFEDVYDCDFPQILRKVKSWLNIDSVSYGGQYMSSCYGYVPRNGNTFQYPKNGNIYIVTTLYYQGAGRGYLKNRLKQLLEPDKTYCVKFHVNIANTSPRGMDGFGIYFGDGSVDTITKCTIPLSYINPQVTNPLGNVISDTLNWVPITGTFVANGNEKYALIGNFLADNAVTTSSINTPSFPQNWTDFCVDEVSCIEADLPAYAGPDRPFIAGDSLFIGRQLDFAIDPGCVWYQLPNATPIATVSGLWVKPVVTTTYVVRQELECSPLKWDTVVLYQTALGLNEINRLNEGLKVYPVPANESLELRIEREDLYRDFKRLRIYNSLGQLLQDEEFSFKDKHFEINVNELPVGIYYIQMKSVTHEPVTKRFLISR